MVSAQRLLLLILLLEQLVVRGAAFSPFFPRWHLEPQFPHMSNGV